MKKLTVLFLVMLLSLHAFSQAKKQSIGFEFSPTLRSLRGTLDDFYKSCIGFSAGLTYQYNINSYLSFKSGIAYEKKGAATGDVAFFDENDNYIGTTRNNFNSDYLIVPILVSASDKKNHFNISCGPYFGYLLRYTVKFDAVGSYPAEKINHTRDTERMDFGWILGIGYDFAISEKVGMSLVIRDDLGIKNLAEGDAVLRTNSLGLRVGLKYNLN
jgi:hypothetical protein